MFSGTFRAITFFNFKCNIDIYICLHYDFQRIRKNMLHGVANQQQINHVRST
jgi:hypothetical protein